MISTSGTKRVMIMSSPSKPMKGYNTSCSKKERSRGQAVIVFRMAPATDILKVLPNFIFLSTSSDVSCLSSRDNQTHSFSLSVSLNGTVYYWDYKMIVVRLVNGHGALVG